jgi:hypothetical protein
MNNSKVFDLITGNKLIGKVVKLIRKDNPMTKLNQEPSSMKLYTNSWHLVKVKTEDGD